LKHPIVLFCKSYRNDVLRVKDLIDSIQLFNQDDIPLFVSTPLDDKKIFDTHINPNLYTWIDDLEICKSNPKFEEHFLKNMKGHTAQQIIKSEFWRLNLCENYLCLDSDARFIKDFYKSDFIDSNGDPYIVMHTADDFMDEMKRNGKIEVIQNFLRESNLVKNFFQRTGTDYDFGPAPFIWASQVWKYLDEKILTPKNMTIWDAIQLHPMEMRWYGEAFLECNLLRSKSVKPLFKVYHYDWQFKNDQNKGVDIDILKANYLGIIQQSNWNKNLDPKFARKSLGSRIWKSIKSFF
jgi:hypothetical protein